MASHIARRLTRPLLVAVLATVGATALASSAYAGPSPKISFSDIAFDVTTVDISSGFASVHLSWRVTDTNPAATSLSGTVLVQEFDGGTAVGPGQVLRFGLPNQNPPAIPDPGSTIASSHYTADFQVRAFAASTTPVWRVTKISAVDDAGTSKRADGDLADLQVTGAQIDTTAPQPMIFVRAPGQENVVFDSGTGVVLHYTADIEDLETGFWKGRLVLSGPAGARVTTPVEVTLGIDGFLQCGHHDIFEFDEVFCDIDVTIPAGSPSGAWSVTSFQLTNNVGVTQRYTGADLGDEPIHVARNDTLSASDFALTPSQVNNWRESQTVTLSMRTAGVQSGLSTVRLSLHECTDLGRGPTVGADGTVTIPITMFDFSARCTVDGIVLTDGAGNVAAYGAVFGAPPLDLASTRVPDTTRPVALTAVLTPSSRVSSDTNRSFAVDVTIDDDGLSPISQYSVSFFDANGATTGGAQGGLEQPPPGGVLHLVGTMNLAPGTYTAAFTLFDKAGNFSKYGYPSANSQPPPSGPLVFTVIAG